MSTQHPEPKEPHASKGFGVKAVSLIATTAVAAWGLSLLVVPALQGASEGLSAYGSICRALGLRPPAEGNASVPGPSAVAWSGETLDQVSAGDATRGAALAADTCVSCHNPNGLSADPTKIPALAGQSARTIFKQLLDIKGGARTNPDMQPLLEKLDDTALADLAAYYGHLPARNADIREEIGGPAAQTLVARGDATRALPPCAACHDVTAGGPLDAPNLVGQYPAYVITQLHAFATGTRRNDVFGRMRTIAAKLTDQEIAELSAYYNARH